MSFSKAHLFPDDIYLLSVVCSACSHPARVIMLQRLIETDDYVPHYELTADIQLSDSTISQHVAKLRSIGLLTSRAVGNRTTEHKLVRRLSGAVEILTGILASSGKSRHVQSL